MTDSEVSNDCASPRLWWTALPQPAIVTILTAMVCFAVLRTWVMPMTSSFWIDEIGTVFVANHSAADPSLRAVPQVPASIYYALPQALGHLLGISEVVYRIPSLLAMAAALILIGLLARRLIHPDAGWFAVLVCFCLREMNYQAADARPYALGTCVAYAGLWFLIRWLDHAKWLDALLFAVCGALLWRIHLLYWPFYLVFAIYAVLRLWRRETEVRPLVIGLVFTAIGVSLLPVVVLALEIQRHAQAHVVASMPSGTDLLDALKPKLILGTVAGAALISWWFRWPRIEKPIKSSSLALVVTAWLCMPACLFLYSHLAGTSVFLMRYLYLALPGLILTITALVSAFVPQRHWRSLALVMGVGVVIFCGHWGTLWPHHHNSDWRGAALAINAAGLGDNLPILCPSPFIESRPPIWAPGEGLGGFFYAHLLVYPIRGHVYPFPYDHSPEVDALATRMSESELPKAGRFLIYGGDLVVKDWTTWFSARPELVGWKHHDIGNFGDVMAVLFER